MSKLKASNSSTEKFSNSINNTNERSEEESSMDKMEKYIFMNPSHGVDESRDQSEDIPEEDPEEESGEELEEDPEENLEIANKWVEVSGSEDQSEDIPEEDPEEESGEEQEEDPEENPEIADKWVEVSGSEDQSEDIPEEDPEEESGEELMDDPEENPEIANKWGEVSSNEDQSEDIPEEDPDEESGEELEDDPEDNPEIGNKLGEVSGNEDQSEDILEEDPDEESCEELEEDPEENLEIGNKWGEVSGNEVPACAQVCQSQKKCKQEGLRSQKLESEPSHLEVSNAFEVSVAPSDKFASKEEGAGSSGKRRRSRWEPQPDGDGIKEDDQTCKRRKTRWSSDDTHLKMLGPLHLPDFIEYFVIGFDEDSKIQELKAELLEINKKLQRPLLGGMPEEERSPSPEPIYNNLGIRINTREVRVCQKLVQKRQNIISELIKLNPSFNTPPDYKPQKLFKKLYIPVKEYPEYNFVGLIIGPRGNTQKRMENETGAKILLRGRGSSKTPSKPASEKEDLHVYIEADNQKSLDAAVGMVEKLLIPIEEGRNKHKLAQLKELAMLNGKLRDENMCIVCGDQGHRHYACPNLQSTFNMETFDTCSSNSIQDSEFSLSSMQNKQARPGKQISDKHLYVGYLPQSVDDNRLAELFSPFGKITEAKVVKDRTTGISRGYGFVKFEDSMDAAVAIARLNGFKIDGKFLKVRIAGLQPNSEFPRLNPIPQKPGPAAVSPNVPSQTVRSGPLHFMLPEHQSTFHDSSATKFSRWSCQS